MALFGITTIDRDDPGQPSPGSTAVTFRSGAGAQDANVFIPLDVAYRHSTQAHQLAPRLKQSLIFGYATPGAWQADDVFGEADLSGVGTLAHMAGDRRILGQLVILRQQFERGEAAASGDDLELAALGGSDVRGFAASHGRRCWRRVPRCPRQHRSCGHWRGRGSACSSVCSGRSWCRPLS